MSFSSPKQRDPAGIVELPRTCCGWSVNSPKQSCNWGCAWDSIPQTQREQTILGLWELLSRSQGLGSRADRTTTKKQSTNLNITVYFISEWFHYFILLFSTSSPIYMLHLNQYELLPTSCPLKINDSKLNKRKKGSTQQIVERRTICFSHPVNHAGFIQQQLVTISVSCQPHRVTSGWLKQKKY